MHGLPDMRSCAVDAETSARQYFASQQRESVGGAPLRSMQLSWDMFGPGAMQVDGVGLHLSKLKVKQRWERS